jgi:hypothetical protein
MAVVVSFEKAWSGSIEKFLDVLFGFLHADALEVLHCDTGAPYCAE